MTDRKPAVKVAIVTGGARGIGRGYAERLSQDGAAVAIVDINEAAARDAADAISASGGNARSYCCDVTDADAAERMAADVARDFGGIDILVNNAALYGDLEQFDHPFSIPVERWRRVVDVNLTSLWLVSRAVYPFMKARGGGRIVNQSSIGAWIGTTADYSATKAGVIGLTRVLARALGRDFITVNAIAPGHTDTEATRRWVSAAGTEKMLSMQAIPRGGTVEDISGALSYLCSEDARHVTGQTIIVDGGFFMR